MNKNIFRRISTAAVVSLALLTIVQCFWVYNLYKDQKGDFIHRVETAAYKSMYSAFTVDALDEDEIFQIKIDINAFALYFETNLNGLDIYQPYIAEVIDMEAEKVMMRHCSTGEDEKAPDLNEGTFNNAHIFQIPIDEDNMFDLRISICFPMVQFLKSIWILLATSIMIVVLLSLVMNWMVKVLFKQKTLDEMRRDFTHNMTHELKTPISVASAAVDALRNFSADSNPERRARYLHMTDTALKQLAAMVERILAVAVEGRMAKLNKERINLGELVSEAASEAQLNIQSNSSSGTSNSGNSSCSCSSGEISVGIKCDENIFIEADRFHFKNVIATLLDNAMKYAPTGDGRKIDIAVSVQRHEVKGEVKIAVADNGCGIAKEHLPHIFEKFYRVPKGDIHQVRGYGLGLSYAQKIVNQHGGTISAESRLGKGTTITITLYDK
jgi:signal transduction histidine kinase